VSFIDTKLDAAAEILGRKPLSDDARQFYYAALRVASIEQISMAFYTVMEKSPDFPTPYALAEEIKLYEWIHGEEKHEHPAPGLIQ
jgi:hypothetical protein